MIVPIFLLLLSINFNVAASNPKATVGSAKSLNITAVILQWLAVAWAAIIAIDYVLSA